MPEHDAGGTPVTVDILVEAGEWPAKAKLQRLFDRAIAAAIAVARAPLAPEPEVSIVLTDDRHSRVLNRRFRRKESPTNVLSFPGAAAERGKFGPLLGDIVLAFETIAAEAKASGVAFDAHLIHLTVHGFLHLLGYDHAAEEEAIVMESLETRIMAVLDIADPYADEPATGG